MDLQNNLIEKMSVELAKDMDFQILGDMLVEIGWVRLFVNYSPPERSWVKMKQWVDDNCQGAHQEHNGIWLFENQKDANWFTLRWAS